MTADSAQENEYDIDKIIKDTLSIQSSIDLLNEQLEAMKLLLVSLGCDLTEIGLEQRDNASLTETECASLEISGARLINQEEFQEGLDYIKPVSDYWWLDSGLQSNPLFNLCVDNENTFRWANKAYVRPILNVTATKPMIGKQFRYGTREWTIITAELAIAGGCMKQVLPYDSKKLNLLLNEWYKMVRYCSKPEPLALSPLEEQPCTRSTLKGLAARVLDMFD